MSAPDWFESCGPDSFPKPVAERVQPVSVPEGDFPVVCGDDAAVDLFAAAMKKKMAESRAKGRDGWYDPEQCPAERLQAMLINHLSKGDPVDVGNFAMMLFNRDLPTAAPSAPAVQVQDGALPQIVGFSRYSDSQERGLLVTFSRRLTDGELIHARAALAAAPAQPAAPDAQDAVDAARYRWLRDPHIGDDPGVINITSVIPLGLDAAIDAARATKEAAQ